MARQIRQFMEQDEITRRNVAIAEYMGAEEMWVRKDFEDPHHRDMPWQLLGKVKQVPYHEDWKLLMPAVEKIMGEFSENIHSWLPMSSDSPKMFHSKLHGAFWLIEGMDKPLIERVWFVVSEYVLALKS